jgi:hypothetical protein
MQPTKPPCIDHSFVRVQGPVQHLLFSPTEQSGDSSSSCSVGLGVHFIQRLVTVSSCLVHSTPLPLSAHIVGQWARYGLILPCLKTEKSAPVALISTCHPHAAAETSRAPERSNSNAAADSSWPHGSCRDLFSSGASPVHMDERVAVEIPIQIVLE